MHWFLYGVCTGLFLAAGIAFYLHIQVEQLKHLTRPTTSSVPAGSDPLDSMDPEERETYLAAWWQDVLEMPEVELEEAEVAYLNWVKRLPEQVS